MVIACDFCNKTFSNKYTLERHQKISCKSHDTKKKCKCEYCHKSYISKSNLDRHQDICFSRREYTLQKTIKKLKKESKREKDESSRTITELRQTIKEKDEEITELNVNLAKWVFLLNPRQRLRKQFPDLNVRKYIKFKVEEKYILYNKLKLKFCRVLSFVKLL